MTAPRELFLVGGEQRADAHFTDEWHSYRRAVVLRLELESGRLERVVEHVTPPEACPEHKPSIVFKAGCRVGDRVFLPTQTEVLTYQLPDWRQVGYLSLPMFNDLHHVRPLPDGDLAVAVTGLDLVARVSPEGEVRRLWNVLGEEPWGRFDREVDYRRVATTKPHRAHPNYLFRSGDELWVTRFEQRDAVCLGDPERRIEIGIQRPHDGVVHDGRVYFTTVDGHVVIASPDTCAVERVVDLNAIDGDDHSLGWCRGLLVLDEDRVVVGFSRLRPSKFRENLRWVKHRVGRRATAGVRPTRVALYDLRAGRRCWQHELESAGLNALFSIHGADRDDP